MEGRLITFEGGEGCGKTTQRDLLAHYLEEKGLQVVKLREPGGVEISENIRKVLLDPKTKGEMDGLTEMFLFSAARAQFVREKIEPLLKEGKIILVDRYYDCTTAYQGYGMGIDLDIIHSINKIASKEIEPHLTLLLDISVEKGHKKLLTHEFGKKDRIERKGSGYHEKVRQGYLDMARKEPGRIKVVRHVEDGIEEMHKQIIKHAEKILKTIKWQKSLQETLN